MSFASPFTQNVGRSYGREKTSYTCGSLFVDHASGKVFNFSQMSTTANETIQSKQRLEALARQECFDIKTYHSDNGIFASKAWKADCDQQLQTYSYSGVGA